VKIYDTGNDITFYVICIMWNTVILVTYLYQVVCHRTVGEAEVINLTSSI